jgi:hypothetical protein
MTKQFSIDEMRESVEDALFGRRERKQGCFVVNAAALELDRFGQPVLPIIEETISSLLVPLARDFPVPSKLLHSFDGVASLWIAYFRIAGAEHAERAAAFLDSLPAPVALAALISSQTAFQTHPKQASSLVIPVPIWFFFRSLAERAPIESKDNAKHLLDSFDAPLEERK